MNTYALSRAADGAFLGFFAADAPADALTDVSHLVGEPICPLEPGDAINVHRIEVLVDGVARAVRPSIWLIGKVASNGSALAWLDGENSAWQLVRDEAAATVRRAQGDEVQTVTIEWIAEPQLTAPEAAR